MKKCLKDFKPKGTKRPVSKYYLCSLVIMKW